MAFEQVARREKAHGDSIWTVAWKDKYIVSGAANGTVKSWNEALEPCAEFQASTLSIVSVASTGKQALSSSLDSHIRVWDLESGSAAPVTDISVGPVECWALAAHPSSKSIPHVATSGQSGHINVWNYRDGTKVQTLEAAGSNKFSMCVDYDNEGARIACGSMNGTVSVFDTATQKRLHSLEAHSMCVRAISFSPDGKYFVSGSDDTQIHVYDVERGAAVSVLNGHSSWILSVRVSPNGKYIASGSSDRKVKVWSMQTGECVATLSGHSDAVWGVAWNNIGDHLVSAGDDDNIIVYKSLEK